MLCSVVKQIKASKIKHLKALINKKNGRKVDEGDLKRRKEHCQVDVDIESVPALIDRHNKAVID